MSALGRWLRMDVGCFESEWLAGLDPVAQHAWTRLLLHVKGVGVGGTAKRMGPTAIQRTWGITPLRFHEMENAALKDGALRIEDGWWVVTGWDKYQKPDRTNSIRQKNFRERTPDDHNGVTERYAALSPVMHALPVEVEVKQLTSKPTSTPRAAGRGWKICPSDFEPSEKHRDLAVELRVSIERELTAFREWEFKDPKTDADRAFFRWLRTAAERGGNGNGKRQGVIEHDGMRLLT